MAASAPRSAMPRWHAHEATEHNGRSKRISTMEACHCSRDPAEMRTLERQGLHEISAMETCCSSRDPAEMRTLERQGIPKAPATKNCCSPRAATHP